MIYLSNRYIFPNPTWYSSSNSTIKQVSMAPLPECCQQFLITKETVKNSVTTFIQLFFQHQSCPSMLRIHPSPWLGWLYCSICYPRTERTWSPVARVGLKCGPLLTLVARTTWDRQGPLPWPQSRPRRPRGRQVLGEWERPRLQEQPAGSLDRSEDKRAGQEGLAGTAPCLRTSLPESTSRDKTMARLGREGSLKGI